MFTSSDIFIFILLVGAGILIWIARRSKSVYSIDLSKTYGNESSPADKKMATHDETSNHTNSGQSNQ